MTNYLIKYIMTLLLMVSASNLNTDIEDHLKTLSDIKQSTTSLGEAYASILLEVTPADLIASFVNLGEPVLSSWRDNSIPAAIIFGTPSGTEADVEPEVDKLVYPSLYFDDPDLNWNFEAESQGLPPKYMMLAKTVLIVRMRRDVFVESVKLLSATHDLTQEIESIIPLAQSEFEIDAWLRAAVYVDSPAITQHMLSVVSNASYSDQLRANAVRKIRDKMICFRKSETFDRWSLWDGLIQTLYDGRANQFEQRISGAIPLLKPYPRLVVLLMNYTEFAQSVGKPYLANRHIDHIERMVGHPLAAKSFRDLPKADLSIDDPIYTEIGHWISANRQAYEEQAEAESEAMP